MQVSVLAVGNEMPLELTGNFQGFSFDLFMSQK